MTRSGREDKVRHMPPPSSRPTRAAVRFVCGALTIACLFAGCAGANLTKEGTRAASETVTLDMQTPDAPLSDADYFVDQVAERTHGQLRVLIVNDYTSINPENELRLAVALRKGRVEMAYIPSRAWERDGGRVLMFRALQAPFLIDNYPLLRAVTMGPIAKQMLASLSRNGLVGLGLVPMELRRPLGRRPLISLAAFRGARVRVITSPTTNLIMRSLGAVPVTDLTSAEVGPALHQGQVVGAESSLLDINNNSYVAEAHYMPTNVVLFAKTETIVVTRHVFERLSPADQSALRAAASATVAHADPADQERAELGELCGQGLRLVTSSPRQLKSLERAAAPVFTVLERDPSTKRAIIEIEQLKHQLPARIATLATCPQTGRSPVTKGAVPFPTGTFVSVLTPKEVANAGLPPDDANTNTLIFRKDGTWEELWSDPTEPAQPPESGPYTVHGDILTLGPAASDWVLNWSYFRGLLTFRVVSDPDQLGVFLFSTNPWRKVQ